MPAMPKRGMSRRRPTGPVTSPGGATSGWGSMMNVDGHSSGAIPPISAGAPGGAMVGDLKAGMGNLMGDVGRGAPISGPGQRPIVGDTGVMGGPSAGVPRLVDALRGPTGPTGGIAQQMRRIPRPVSPLPPSPVGDVNPILRRPPMPADTGVMGPNPLDRMRRGGYTGNPWGF